MKKALFTLAALLAVTFSMNAQSKFRFNEDVDLTFGNDVFVVEPLSYIGFGYHLKNNEMSTEQNAFNSEFFVNIMELGFRPFRGGMISLGVDYDLDQYRLNKKYYWYAVEEQGAIILPIEASLYKSVKYSRINVHTFSIPLSFELSSDKCAFRVGVAGEYNLPAVNKNYFANIDGGTSRYRVKNIPVNEFTYSLFGSIAYGGFGVYVRYRPMYQLGENSPQFKTLTIGAVLGIGM